LLVRIQSSGGLSKEDIERMVQEAERHKEEDTKRRDLVEARNKAEGVINDTEKNLDQFKDTLSADDSSAVKEEIKKLREILSTDSENLEKINEGINSLQQESLKRFEAAYKAVSFIVSLYSYSFLEGCIKP
jgi:molecular chaperone DnaK